MKAVSTIEGRAIPYGAKNVDTDVIIPAKWLKTISREGLGEGAFESVRAKPDNVFDDPEYAGAPILIAGDNFGCGSSREHAAWALLDLGITAVIAPSFSDIFSGNAFKNGIFAVALPQEQVDRLLIHVENEIIRGGIGRVVRVRGFRILRDVHQPLGAREGDADQLDRQVGRRGCRLQN